MGRATGGPTARLKSNNPPGQEPFRRQCPPLGRPLVRTGRCRLSPPHVLEGVPWRVRCVASLTWVKNKKSGTRFLPRRAGSDGSPGRRKNRADHDLILIDSGLIRVRVGLCVRRNRSPPVLQPMRIEIIMVGTQYRSAAGLRRRSPARSRAAGFVAGRHRAVVAVPPVSDRSAAWSAVADAGFGNPKGLSVLRFHDGLAARAPSTCAHDTRPRHRPRHRSRKARG